MAGTCIVRLSNGPPHRVINNDHYDRPDHGDDQAVNVESRHAGLAEEVEDVPSHNGADDPQDNVENNPLAGLVHDLAANKACNQTQDDPSQD
jgi:hypothetical protein